MSNHTKHDVLLSVKDVSVELGGNLILRDMNLQVHDIRRPPIITTEGETTVVTGQVIGLLGPSGRGKTQFFRRLAGLDRPTTGEVKIGTKLLVVNPGDVGVVFQEYILFDELDVEQNLMEAALQAGLTKEQALAYLNQITQQFGLDKLLRHYPYKLSGGQRQRVAIAQQVLRACNEPNGFLLLMDEPFSGLSPELTEQACKIIQAVTNMHENNTTIVVTHDVSAAVAICDTILLLGYEYEDGKPKSGATIVETIDLVERDLAWHPDVLSLPEAQKLISEIKLRFRTL